MGETDAFGERAGVLALLDDGRLSSEYRRASSSDIAVEVSLRNSAPSLSE
jgi:hypothetical protein